MGKYDTKSNTSTTSSDNYESDFIDIDTSDAKEPAAVEPGEYKIRITGFRKDAEKKIVRTSDKGNRYFIVTFDIPSEEFSKGLSNIFTLPTDEMDAKQKNAVKWRLEVFKRAFNLTELKFDSMIGREGYAILNKTFDDQYGEQNNITNFIAGA